MRHARSRLALVVAATALAAISAASGASITTSGKVRSAFKAQTGSALTVDPATSLAGHYTALVLPPSAANQARYGRFTLYVVSPSAIDDDVRQLLADTHTGAVGTPGPSQIYWEKGRYLSGSTYWLAKRRYGANVVLWWFGPQQKVDAAFTRLHRLLTKITA